MRKLIKLPVGRPRKRVKIEFIKHTCSECSFEISCVNKEEFHIEDELGWTFKKGKFLCNICKLGLFDKNRKKVLTYDI